MAFNHLKRLNRQLCLSGALFLSGLAILCVPYLQKLLWLLIVNCVIGAMTGALETGSTAWIVEMWPNDANVYLQSYQAAFSTGLLVGPLLAKCFAIPETLDSVMFGGAFSVNSSSLAFARKEPLAFKTSTTYAPYTICGYVILLCSFVHLLMYLVRPYEQVFRSFVKEAKANQTRASDFKMSRSNSVKSEPKETATKCPKLAIALMCGVLGLQQMSEHTTINFLTTFAIRLQVSEEKAKLLIWAYSSSCAVFGFLSILLAMKLKTTLMLLIDFLLMLIGSLLLFLRPNCAANCEDASLLWLWIGLVVMGAGTASSFPTGYAFLQEILNVTNGVSGLLLVASNLGQIFMPIFVGQMIEELPMVFVYINVSTCFGALLLFVLCAKIC